MPSSDPDLSFETRIERLPGSMRGAELIQAGHTTVALEIPVQSYVYQVTLSWGDLLFMSMRNTASGVRARYQGKVALARPGDSTTLEIESESVKLTCSVQPKLPDELIPSPSCEDDCDR